MSPFGIDDIDDALKAIKHAWIAGVVSGSFTFFVAVWAISSGGAVLGTGLDGWILIDAFLLFGLAYGVYRKSRVAAVVLLLYFALSQIEMRLDGAGASGIGLALMFVFFYTRGMVGTFAFHKFNRTEVEAEVA